MYRVGFELTIPVFERAKTVYALDRAATVIGTNEPLPDKNVNKYTTATRVLSQVR
jgi:hypothetical protein